MLRVSSQERKKRHRTERNAVRSVPIEAARMMSPIRQRLQEEQEQLERTRAQLILTNHKVLYYMQAYQLKAEDGFQTIDDVLEAASKVIERRKLTTFTRAELEKRTYIVKHYRDGPPLESPDTRTDTEKKNGRDRIPETA